MPALWSLPGCDREPVRWAPCRSVVVSVPGSGTPRWDGTQTGFDLDAESLLDEMADDLLYHGDLNAALRRMMQQGFQDRNDEQLMGLREMLEKLRERRRQELENRDLGGVYDDIAEQLDEVVDMEREGIDRRVDEATRSGDQRRQELVEDVAEERRRQLEELPPDLAGQRAGDAELRVHGRRGARAVRGAHGPAARAADAELLQPAVRGHAEHDPRAHGRR